MTIATATLFAAGIAAFSAAVNLIWRMTSAKDAEARGAHRQIIQPHLENLGECVHAIVATSAILMKTKSDASLSSWKGKAHKVQATLNLLRPKIRYPLWGLDEGVRVLIRLPNWTANFKKFPDKAKDLLYIADRLRWAIDVSVRHSYSYGRPPVYYERWIVNHYATKMRNTFIEASKRRK